MVEAVQLFTKVGAFDVDDILLNVTGTMIGYGMFAIVRKIKIKIKVRKKLNKGN